MRKSVRNQNRDVASGILVHRSFLLNATGEAALQASDDGDVVKIEPADIAPVFVRLGYGERSLALIVLV